MKITLAQDQLVIDYSLVMPVATGAILALGGVAIGIRALPCNRTGWRRLDSRCSLAAHC